MGPAVHPVHVRPPVRWCRSPHRCMLVLVVWEFSMSCLNSARAWQVSLSYSSITRRACVTLNQLQTKCLHHVIFRESTWQAGAAECAQGDVSLEVHSFLLRKITMSAVAEWEDSTAPYRNASVHCSLADNC